MNQESGYGVCRLSVVPVMRVPGWDQPTMDELLFGEPYRVLARKSEWLKISCSDTPMTGVADGWIPKSHHHAIEEDYYLHLLHSEFRMVTDITSTVLYRKVPLVISVGSVVPVSSGELFKVEEQLAFNGEARPVTQRRDAEFLCQTAIRFLHFPERAGGRTPFGMDPMAWIRMIHHLCGHPFPRKHEEVQTVGAPVDVSDAQAGDLMILEADHESRAGILLSDGRLLFMEGQVQRVALHEGQVRAARTWRLVDARRVSA